MAGASGEPERRVLKGRGAVDNRAGRFEPRDVRPLEDDVWWAVEEAPERVETTVTPEATRSILSTNDSPDVPFERSINPYKGCEHGCAYCFARPTHSFLGLSPGLDFETRIFSKPDAPALLRETLAKERYLPRVVVVGANTDPYQPAEARLGITRGVLEVLWEHRHPVAILTKSSRVLRDLDLLAAMARERLAAVMVSITTLDGDLARRLEPRAASPGRRLRTVEALAAAGVPAGVLASPMIPALNDHELEAILEAAAGAGASSAGYALLRLPHELKGLFAGWLETHVPARAEKVLSLLRSARAGELYRAEFGTRMRGTGPYADLLAQRFRVAVRRLGLDRWTPDLDTSRFRVPPRPGAQGRLFE